MPMLTDKMNIGKINIIKKKAAKVMLEFKGGELHIRKFDIIKTYLIHSITIAQSQTKNLKNKPLCGKKKKIN